MPKKKPSGLKQQKNKKSELVRGKAGRPPGALSRRTIEARELAERMGVDPLQILLHIMNNDWKALGYKSARHVVAYSMSGKPIYEDRIKMDHRYNAASRAMPFLYAQRRAEDRNGKVGDNAELPPPDATPQLIENQWIIKQVVAPGETAATVTQPVENKSSETEIKDVVSVCYDSPAIKKA